jgi:hypothetical protein
MPYFHIKCDHASDKKNPAKARQEHIAAVKIGKSLDRLLDDGVEAARAYASSSHLHHPLRISDQLCPVLIFHTEQAAHV